MKKSARIHKFLSVVLSAVMLLAALPMASFAAAATLTYENLEYTVTNGEVTITRYAGTTPVDTVTVPEQISGNPVTTIGDGAFGNEGENAPKNVILPQTITKIGMGAFMAACNTKINLAELQNLTYIGAYAFVDTALDGDLVLPESVTEIGASAFSMTKITSLRLGKNVKPVSVQSGEPWSAILVTTMPSMASLIKMVGLKPYTTTESERNIAMNCTELKEITVDARNPYLRSYGGVLFNKTMTEMYSYPSGKQMHTYIIPLTVRNFYNAFGGLHLPPISVKLYGKEMDVMDDNGGLLKLSNGWTDFGANNPLKSVVIPAGVNSICYAAFYNTGLTSIFIPKNVEVIGKKAFWHCRDLTTVGFDRNSSYKELPEQCFKDCESLKNVTFGKVDYLAALAFGNCTTIESIDLTNVLSLDATAFDDCANLSEVVYRDTEADSAAQAQGYAAKRFLADADASSGKATVSASAFANKESLKTVMLGNSVGKIENLAFANCTNLTTAYISADIAEENISDTAFKGCTGLTVVVPTEDCGAYRYAVKNNIPVTTMVISPIANQSYTGEAVEPEFTVKASGKTLTRDVDYEVFYKDNVEAGTASITVLGKGNYSIFAALAKFAILRRDLSEVQISNILPQTANENGAEPELALSCGSYILQKDVDYTVAYENNTAPGTASVTVTGIGNFKGSQTLSFAVLDAPDTNPIEILPGDIDGDGQIALTDYALIKAIAVGINESPDASVIAAADLNGDGVVDMFDLALLDLRINSLV